MDKIRIDTKKHDSHLSKKWTDENAAGNEFLWNARIEIPSKKQSGAFWKGEGWNTAPLRPRNIALPYQWLFTQSDKLDFPGRLKPVPGTCKTTLEVLDYGCGRGQDAMRFGFKKYDPNWFPDSPWDPVRIEGKYDFIFCIYVLDVILTPEKRHEVVNDIRRLLKPGGQAYIINRCDDYASMKDGRVARKTVDSSWDLARVEPAREYGCAEIYRNFFFQVWVCDDKGPCVPENTVELKTSWTGLVSEEE